MIGGLKHLSKRDYTTAGTKDRHNKTELLLYRSDPCWSKICLNLDSWKLHFITRSAELTSFVNEPLARGIRKLIFRGFFSLVSFIFFSFSLFRENFTNVLYIYIYISREEVGWIQSCLRLEQANWPLRERKKKLILIRGEFSSKLNIWRNLYHHLSLSKNLSKDLVKDLASIWYYSL